MGNKDLKRVRIEELLSVFERKSYPFHFKRFKLSTTIEKFKCYLRTFCSGSHIEGLSILNFQPIFNPGATETLNGGIGMFIFVPGTIVEESNPSSNTTQDNHRNIVLKQDCVVNSSASSPSPPNYSQTQVIIRQIGIQTPPPPHPHFTPPSYAGCLSRDWQASKQG